MEGIQRPPQMKDDVIDAMRSAGFDCNNLLAYEDILGMLRSLWSEDNVEISNKVEDENTKAIEAYKRRWVGFL